MKRTTLAAMLALGALSLYGAEQTTITPAQPVEDSPLVRAAKAATKSSAKNKKKIVITNESLVKTGGHFTTTSAQQPLPHLPPPDPTAARAALEAKRAAGEQAARAKAEQQAADEKRAKTERANAIVEGDDPAGIYEDPATAEARADQQSPATPQQPPTMKVQKPPL